jgi:hypothetical protein
LLFDVGSFDLDILVILTRITQKTCWFKDPFGRSSPCKSLLNYLGAKRIRTSPTYALCGYKGGYSETTCENARVAYTFDFLTLLVPQRGFEPLTHALRIRRSF